MRAIGIVMCVLCCWLMRAYFSDELLEWEGGEWSEARACRQKMELVMFIVVLVVVMRCYAIYDTAWSTWADGARDTLMAPRLRGETYKGWWIFKVLFFTQLASLEGD